MKRSRSNLGKTVAALTSGMNRKTRPSYQGHPAAAKFLTNGLLESGFDLSYAYKPLHHHLGHAFLNTLLYLDYDRQGFRIPCLSR